MSSYLSWFGYGNQHSAKEREDTGNNSGGEGSEKVNSTEQQKSATPKDGSSVKGTSENNGKDNKDGVKSKSTKDIAKGVGNILFGYASAAGKKLKESVDETLDKGILGDFQRENEKFIQEKRSKSKESAVPPWVGYHEENAMKDQILALSTDERNFCRDPPDGVEFHFSLSSFMPVAVATLNEDPNLKEMRFKLVPRKISEFCFWRNYFYRVSLIKQSSQLLSLSKSDSRPQSSSSLDKLEIADKGDESNEADGVKIVAKSKNDDVIPEASPPTQEFVSDSFQQRNEGLSLEEMSQMGVKNESQKLKQRDGDGISDWEKEFQEELNDFEFVSEDPTGSDETDPNWEKEIEDILELEETDKITEPK